MSSQTRSAVRDLSMHFRAQGTGSADMRRMWLCGHKSHGGHKRGGLLLMCARCVEAKGKQ